MNNRVKKIINLLNNKKAEDVQTINLEGKEYITDIVIIATSLNEKHGHSLLNELKTELKLEKENFLTIDDEGEWVVADLGDIMIHIMTQSYRQKYTLELFLEELKSSTSLTTLNR